MLLHRQKAGSAAGALSQSRDADAQRRGAPEIPRAYLARHGVTIGGVTLPDDPSDAQLALVERALGAGFTARARDAAARGAPSVVALVAPYLSREVLDQPAVRRLAEAYVRYAARATLDELSRRWPMGTMPPAEIARARHAVAQLPADERAGWYLRLQGMSRYNSQRDTASLGSHDPTRADDSPATDDNMCNLTTLAMILESLGIANPKPREYPQFEDYLEALRIERHLGIRADRVTIVKLAAVFGVAAQVVSDGKALQRADWFALRDQHLAAGKGVMLHVPGHFLRLQAVTDDGIVVDDPIGREKIVSGVRKRVADNATGRYDDQGEDNPWTWEIERFTLRGVVVFG